MLLFENYFRKARGGKPLRDVFEVVQFVGQFGDSEKHSSLGVSNEGYFPRMPSNHLTDEDLGNFVRVDEDERPQVLLNHFELILIDVGRAHQNHVPLFKRSIRFSDILW